MVARAGRRWLVVVAGLLVVTSSSAVGATLDVRLHLAATMPVVLSTKPLVLDSRLSLDLAGPVVPGRSVGVRAMVPAGAAPSYATLALRGERIFGSAMAPASIRGWLFGVPAAAVVETADRAALAAARRDGVSTDGMPRIAMVAVPHPDKHLSLRMGTDGTLAVNGKLYFLALRRSGAEWGLDLDRKRTVEPYAADFVAAVQMAAPPCLLDGGRLPDAAASTTEFRGFAGVARRTLVAILGSDADPVLKTATCPDPRLQWTATHETGCWRLVGRTVSPCHVTVDKAPCLTVTAIERTVVVHERTGEILADEGACIISDLAMSHPLFSLRDGSASLSYRIVGAAGTVAGSSIGLLGVAR